MRRNPISRRTMLRGMLGGAAVAIGLPTLEVFMNDHGDALAQGGFPKRFGIFFWGNGMIEQLWNPATVGTDWWKGADIVDPGHQLNPLAWKPGALPTDPMLPRVGHRVSLVTGLDVKTQSTVAHGSGASGIFSGQSLNNGAFPGQSLDQMIADTLAPGTIYRSIETSCEVTNGEALTGPSWSFQDSSSQNPSAASPHLLFDRIFGSTFVEPGGTPIIDPKNALRRSVLDVVGDDLGRLRRRVGSADKVRLDQHLASIRALELRLALLEANPPSFASCRRPDEPALSFPLDTEGRIQLVEINKAMSKILAMAYACDLTRVASHWCTGSVSNLRFPGQTAGHHQLTHDEPGDQPNVHEIVQVVMDMFATMIEEFEAVQEGTGTLLDNMVLFGTSDCSLGRQHKLANYPMLLAGSAGGKLKQGYHFHGTGDNASRVLLTMAQAVGVTRTEFGAIEGYVNDGLHDIEV